MNDRDPLWVLHAILLFPRVRDLWAHGSSICDLTLSTMLRVKKMRFVSKSMDLSSLMDLEAYLGVVSTALPR
jgi:hypothetical protein